MKLSATLSPSSADALTRASNTVMIRPSRTDHARGQRGSAYRCPLALALSRYYRADVGIARGFVVRVSPVWGCAERLFPLTADAWDAVARYDGGTSDAIGACAVPATLPTTPWRASCAYVAEMA